MNILMIIILPYHHFEREIVILIGYLNIQIQLSEIGLLLWISDIHLTFNNVEHVTFHTMKWMNEQLSFSECSFHISLFLSHDFRKHNVMENGMNVSNANELPFFLQLMRLNCEGVRKWDDTIKVSMICFHLEWNVSKKLNGGV